MPRKKAEAPETEKMEPIAEETVESVEMEEHTTAVIEEEAGEPEAAISEEADVASDEAEMQQTEPAQEDLDEDAIEPEQPKVVEEEPVFDLPEEQESGESSPKPQKLHLGVLKLRADEEDRQEMSTQELTWNELANYNRTKRTVPVTVTGLETTQLAGDVVVAYYKQQRVIVPMSEMAINLSDDIRYLDGSVKDRLARICNTMLGAEIDVVIKGMDKQNNSVVASRKDAMNRKRERFYLTPLSDGLPQVREGRIVEGRVIAVTPMVARIELFGVEVSMSASQLSWDWISDVSTKYHVGDKINVLIEKLEGDSIDDLRITPDVKSLIPNVSVQNLEKCAVQGKYVGEVTNIHNGTVYLRLQIGVNAIAHTNYDKRNPGKGDIVSFVVTRINPDYGNVSGVITRIIKQHI